MEVPLALLADYANVSREGKLNVMGVFNRIAAKSFPAQHPEMQLVFRLEAQPVERGQEKKVEVVFQDEDGQELMRLSGNVTVPKEAPLQSLNIDQILKLNNLVFSKPGTYRFDILVNGEPKREVPCHLVELPSGDDQQG